MRFCSVFRSPPAWVLSAGNLIVCLGSRRMFFCGGSGNHYFALAGFLAAGFLATAFALTGAFACFCLCFCRRLCNRFCLGFGRFRCRFYRSLHGGLCFSRGLCRGLRRFCRNLLCCRHTHFLPFKYSIPPHRAPARPCPPACEIVRLIRMVNTLFHCFYIGNIS